MSQTLPGFEKGRTLAPREIMLAAAGTIQVPIVVDAAKSADGKNVGFTYELRPGWLMSRIAASGKWSPCKRTRVTPTGGGTATVVPVVNAAAFQVGDVVSVGAATGKTITAVDQTANTITVSGSAFAFANNDAVAAEDGSQTCRGILLDFVRLRNADNTAPKDQAAGLLIQGAVKTAMLLGDAAAVRAGAAARLAGIRFSDDHGQ